MREGGAPSSLIFQPGNMAAATRCLVDTISFADTVEWCKDPRYREILACGTYQLDEKSGQRLGGIELYKLQEDMQGLEKTGSVSVAGVLDMKWSPVVGNTTQLLLLTANADQHVRMYSLDTTSTEHQTKLEAIGSVKIPSDRDSTDTNNSILCLSIDVQHSSNEAVVISDSAGCIDLIDSRVMGVVRQWKGHAYEAWVATFDNWNNEIILSGGDDCKLFIWDRRESKPIYTKRFEMGVCCIQSHPQKENQYITGSYDEVARLWDQRKPSTPLKELHLGGGIWRLKWHPCLPNVLGSATMYAGFHILNIETQRIIQQYKGGRDEDRKEKEKEVLLGYGIDWFPCSESETRKSTTLLASCSFYDHSLQLWTCEIL